MKRSFNQIALTAALLLTLGVTTTFAANTTDNGGVNASFRKDFKQAELISTDAGKDYTKITFKMNGIYLTAFYNDNGELLAVTHNITSGELPINLLLPIKRDYADYWISDLFEFDSNGTTSYYITLENANTKLTLRSVGSEWETYNKTTKN
jgi:hypothetical protein